jgi:phosphoribosylglycinamide formyltransferase 1
VSGELRVGFCVSGGGRLFRAAVAHSRQVGIVPALLVTETKCDAELAGVCANHNIPMHNLNAGDRRAFDDEVMARCVAARLDLLCLTFDRIIPAALVDHYHGRVINVHMGLLPAFKGLHGLEQAVSFGARFAGATIHEVGEEVDGGGVIAQCVLGIRRGESPESLGRRVFGPLRLMFLQVLAWYAAGRVCHDERGQVWVRDAVYGELPISPGLEDAFPD